MGKRQTRIFQKDIAAALPDLQQRDAHVVQRSGKVLRGIITAISDRHLTLLNQRLHPHSVALEEIEEIVYDRETAF
jgi:hypothetical protein